MKIIQKVVALFVVLTLVHSSVAWADPPPGFEVEPQSLAIKDAEGVYVTDVPSLDPPVTAPVEPSIEEDDNRNSAIGGIDDDVVEGNLPQAVLAENSPAVEEKAPIPIVADGAYVIASSENPNLCLDVYAASRSEGAALSLYHRNGALNQRFWIERGTDGFYSIRAMHSGLSFDVEGASKVPATNVNQWTYFEVDNQRWGIEMGDDGLYVISSKATGMVLDIAWGEATEGARLQVFTANGESNQKFSLIADDSVPLSGGLYMINPSYAPEKNLDVEGGSREEGASILLWGSGPGSNQKYEVEKVGDSIFTFRSLCSGMYLAAKDSNVYQSLDSSSLATQWRARPGFSGITLQNVATNEYMDVSWAGSFDGCKIGLWARNGQPNQSFEFAPTSVVDEGCYALVSAIGGRVLDMSGASRSNGAKVVTWSWHDSGNQKWIVRPNGDRTYRILNARSGKSLDIEGTAGVAGSNAIQWEYNGGSNQRWTPIPTGDGWFYLRASNGLYLDVAWGMNADGARVQGWSFTGDNSDAQRFSFMPTTYVQANFEDKMASFSTISTNSFSGTYNMQRALKSFDNVILWPGHTISFFGVAGPCGQAQGYLPAGVVGGIGYGGGICQASTTLYGAALRAGMTIVERKNHSIPSTYVPIGQDAMVDFGTSDLKFRNDFSFPIKFSVECVGDYLTCSIYGIQPDWFDYIEVQSWYTSSRSAAAHRAFMKNGLCVRTESLPSSYY